MQALWVAIDGRGVESRVSAMAGPKRTLLRARLCKVPSHPRAIASLLEALALWQGMPVRAVLYVDGAEAKRGEVSYHRASSTPLFSLDVVPASRRRRRPEEERAYPDPRQLQLFEASR